MLTLLKGAYPARLKKVLIVTAPLWFKAPFKVLRLFVREKLRDRVFTVSIDASMDRGEAFARHNTPIRQCYEAAQSAGTFPNPNLARPLRSRPAERPRPYRQDVIAKRRIRD